MKKIMQEISLIEKLSTNSVSNTIRYLKLSFRLVWVQKRKTMKPQIHWAFHHEITTNKPQIHSTTWPLLLESEDNFPVKHKLVIHKFSFQMLFQCKCFGNNLIWTNRILKEWKNRKSDILLHAEKFSNNHHKNLRLTLPPTSITKHVKSALHSGGGATSGGLSVGGGEDDPKSSFG